MNEIKRNDNEPPEHIQLRYLLQEAKAIVLPMSPDLFADFLVESIDRSLQVRVQDRQRSSSLAGMRSQRQRSECLLANSAPQRVAQPQAAIQRHGLQRVLDSGS